MQKNKKENEFIIHFGFNGDEGYISTKSKPVQAKNEQEAMAKLKEQFESYEGIPCEIFFVEEL